MELYFSCAWLHHGSLDRSIGAIVYFDIKLIFDLCAEMRAALSRPPGSQLSSVQELQRYVSYFKKPNYQTVALGATVRWAFVGDAKPGKKIVATKSGRAAKQR